MSDPYGISDYLEDPDIRAQAEALAPAVQQYPEIVQTMSNMTGVDPGQAAGSDFNVLTGRTKRDDLWDWLQKRQQANQQDFDAKEAVFNKQTGQARVDDALRRIRLGLSEAASISGGFEDRAQSLRSEMQQNPNADAIGSKRAQLYKWLQDKNKSEIDLFDAANRGLSAESSDAYKRALMAKMAMPKDEKEIDPGGFKTRSADQRDRQIKLAERHQKYLEDHAGDKEEAADEKLERKKSEMDRKLAVPGWELTGEVLPSVKEAEGLRASVEMHTQVDEGVRQLIAMAKQYGAQVIPGPTKTKMHTLAKDLQLTAKGQKLFDLGVLTGNDLAQLEAVIPDPSKPNWDGLTGNAVAALEQTLQSGNRRINAAMAARGYRASKLGDQPKSKPVPPGMKRFTVNGKPYTINASDVDAFLRDFKGQNVQEVH